MSVPRGPDGLEGKGGGPVPSLFCKLHPVAGDDAPMLFAVGHWPAGVGVGEVGGDGGNEPGPLTIAPGPLIQHVQALQAVDLGPPQTTGAGKVEGVAQVSLLSPQAGDEISCPATFS